MWKNYLSYKLMPLISFFRTWVRILIFHKNFKKIKLKGFRYSIFSSKSLLRIYLNIQIISNWSLVLITLINLKFVFLNFLKASKNKWTPNNHNCSIRIFTKPASAWRSKERLKADWIRCPQFSRLGNVHSFSRNT